MTSTPTIKNLLKLGLLSFLILQACSFEPDLGKKISIAYPDHYHYDSSSSLPKLNAWWHYFHDPRLNKLIASLLQKNFDLKKASYTLLQFKKKLDVTGSTLYPQFNLQAQVQREGKYVPYMPNQKKYLVQNNYSVFLMASYELDLFRKLSDQKKAAFQQILENQYDVQTLRQSIICSFVSTYLQLSLLDYKLKVQSKIICLEQSNLKYLLKSYEQGNVDYSQIIQKKITLAELKNSFKELQHNLTSTQYQLCTFLNQYPHPISFTLWEKLRQIKLTIKPGLPSSLLKSRPDILAKEKKLKQLALEAKIKRKARFPQITLTGQTGYTSNKLKQLFTPTNTLFNLAAGLVQPLFEAGKLKREEEIAVLEYKKAEIDYAKTLLQAFKEVEVCLDLSHSLKAQLAQLKANLDLQEKNLLLTQYQYNKGNASYVDLNQAKISLLKTKLNLEQTRLNYFINQINLIKALGGAWVKGQIYQ
ncbi:MAG: TolC family protein [Desulfonauticus sp.]|nr:TolC family protein [Desulfonauticus sp.]